MGVTAVVALIATLPVYMMLPIYIMGSIMGERHFVVNVS